MKITIGHLYPDLLNLYGDRGNIQCLMKRCLWRGIEAETIAYELDDRIDFSKLDIVLLGGGSDREQMLVCEAEGNPEGFQGVCGRQWSCDRNLWRVSAPWKLL